MNDEQKEKPPVSEGETLYEVKLYHEFDQNTACKNQGKSDRFFVYAPRKEDVRGKVESGDTEHFKGDVCKGCGIKAKVTVWIQTATGEILLSRRK